MPNYLYACDTCKTEAWRTHSVKETPKLLCHACAMSGLKNPLRRMIAGTSAFQLKPGGVGWAWNSYSPSEVPRIGKKRMDGIA